MRAVFADTSYWIALLGKRDPWRGEALRARRDVADAPLVTVDEVLVEFLAALSAAGPETRVQAASFVRSILAHPNIEVVAQSRDSFLNGLALYSARRDKTYSLTDCVAINLMRARSISAALTTDEHFAQEGFTALMRRGPASE